MTYTGGPLNELNGKMGISAPFRSVPVMKLIRTHNPLSKDALVQLIAYHYNNDCPCGIKSQGTVEMFGKNLYESQLVYWKEYRYTLKECIQWEYDLFVVQSLKGGIIEKKALHNLNEILTNFQFEEAEGFLDEELRIDIIIKKNTIKVGGIQIKPLTYKLMRQEVISFNKMANQKWRKPVFYMFYDKDENFINKDEVVLEIQNL
ncbi:MjaI family restriction endonuclease [Gelidibacter pelagius]|uniref:MjaI family restriction endonuclease n=1 Tax=Gelidibacter pelagius TaxID=2819985 RepID=A0ABS3SNL2_9FLAO|nr:MjaI family restriction endonuclease [Gelidibacter pelagius]MBO3097302.1 MjaI family restriction endonuclease [Gelidibacter pelagius]